MKLVGLVNAYNEIDLIERSLDNKYPFFDELMISDNCYKQVGRSTDGTSEVIDNYPDPENKISRVDLSRMIYCSNTSVNEATIKTHMSNQCIAEEGDWVMICDADEFYMEDQLAELKNKLSQIEKPFIRVQADCFFYNKWTKANETHGRIFKYKPGSFFRGGHNKFHWPTGIIYDKRYEYLMSREDLKMFHMKHVKPLKRQNDRYDIYSDGMSNRKQKWLNNVFYVWPKDPDLAYKNCKEMFDSDSFDTGKGGHLENFEGPWPMALNDYNIDIFGELLDD